ncbi:MAG: UDP-N-acetylmuramate--L-alanine ligase [Dehalococcoidia bacterium]
MSAIRGPVHLIGIGGMHMSAIAQLLLERGVRVTGSDIERSERLDRLEAMGATIYARHAAENLGDAALVVATAAVTGSNPEVAEAKRRGIPVLLRAEMVARLMEGKRVIAVAGSHGKTTTSSLIAFILRRAGRNPMYLLGGESIDLGGHASWGEGDVCVVEADEYKDAFLEYEPATAVITNIEADHLDYFGSEERYHRSFVLFARRVRPGGVLLPCADDAGARAVGTGLDRTDLAVEPYGLGEGAEWRAADVDLQPDGAAFTVSRGHRELGRVRVATPGEHFVRNALAAVAACSHEGVAFETVAAACEAFRGARRRLEVLGEAGGVLVVDDYAHHPTEVRATLSAARKRWPGRRIIGIHQPHTYSRIAYLWNQWLACWEGLGELVILETYAAREQPVEGRRAEDLAAAITAPPAHYARVQEEAARLAASLAKPGDIVMTIGAGDVTDAGPRVLELLR